MKRLAGWVVAFTVLLAAPTHAVQPSEVLPDPALEARARGLSAELRCLVCQNQSIDDSDAPLARDLRVLVRDRLKLGESDDAIRRFLVERYGAFVLLRPPFTRQTALLWLSPCLIVVLAGTSLYYARRRRVPAQSDVVSDLSRDERDRLAMLLEPGAGPRP